MTDVAIDVSGLTKYYGSFRGIEDVTFQVEPGSIHGFLGPNGAGKTTTIRILVGLMGPSSGTAHIFGHEAGSLAAKKLIGYLPSDFGLPRHYTVSQYLDLIETLQGGAPYREELVTRMQLDSSRKTAELSRGNRQKVSIVQALMHEPRILIADEPTAGLDPLMQAEFNAYLKEYIDRGGTVFVSSHILADVQGICEKIEVIRDGSIVSSGEITELLSGMPRKIVVTPRDGMDIEQLATDIGAKVGTREFDKISLFVEGDLRQSTKQLLDRPEVLDFAIPSPSLEEYFMQIYTGKGMKEGV